MIFIIIVRITAERVYAIGQKRDAVIIAKRNVNIEFSIRRAIIRILIINAQRNGNHTILMHDIIEIIGIIVAIIIKISRGQA